MLSLTGNTVYTMHVEEFTHTPWTHIFHVEFNVLMSGVKANKRDRLGVFNNTGCRRWAYTV